MERKAEEFEDDRKKWKIYFDLKPDEIRVGNSTVFVRFSINREYRHLTEDDLANLKKDLKDLGKFRIIKQGKDFLK